jgi:glycosyltransferase involved in cell wall biosynthesis
MKFSICIPSHNSEAYLERTLRSVLLQEGVDLEVIVSDNASTDRSAEIVRSVGDSRVKLRVNTTQIGFAANLDRAASTATGDVIVVVPSDDLMWPGALRIYQDLYTAIEGTPRTAIVTSSAEQIDPEDRVTAPMLPDRDVWRLQDRTEHLPFPASATAYRVPADELLRRCLRTFRNPFRLLGTAYPRALYESIEGYGAGRHSNPEKWFHWRLLGVASAAYLIDRPLFADRWHPSSHTPLRNGAVALKHMVDAYANTVDLPPALLERVGMNREEIERAFVEHGIARHGLEELARNGSANARRILLFGASAYPARVARSPRVWALAALLASGPIGSTVAKLAYLRSGRERWVQRV